MLFSNDDLFDIASLSLWLSKSENRFFGYDSLLLFSSKVLGIAGAMVLLMVSNLSCLGSDLESSKLPK